MKIGVNALFLQTPASGSSQNLIHLLNTLAEIDQQNEYILLGAALQENPPFRSPWERFPYQVSPVPTFARSNENIEKLVWEQLTGPWAARKAGVDLLHVPYFAPPLFPRTPAVITIHDVIPQRLPIYRADTKTKAYMELGARAAHKA